MRKLALCFLLCTVLALSACNSGPKAIVISVATPTGAQALDLGQSFNITVSVSNDTLNKGVTFTLTGVGTLSNQTPTGATYTAPAAGAGGSATITITSASDPTKMTTITTVVTAAPSITSPAALPAATQGTAYNVTLTETGGAGTLNFTVSSGSLPAGLNLSSSGTITGKATGPNGTVTFTVKVTDSSTVSPQSSTETFTIVVNQAPAITSANSATFTAGAAGSFTVTSTGSPTPALAETGALPAGITFVDNGNGTGTLAGTSSAVGAYPISFTATNGVGTAGSQNFMLTIGQAPAITSGAATTFTVGSAGTFSVTTSGFPAPALTETGALPTGVTFVDNKNGTATLAGTPAAGTGKTYSLSITAQNGIGANAVQTFTLTVDQAPAITSASSTTFTQGVAGSFTVTTTGLPTPALTETGALPTGVTFIDNGNGTATLAGIPSGTAGTYPLTFKATNSVNSATQSFTLTIGQAPAITSATSTTFTVGTAGTFSVTTTGFPVPSLTKTGTLPSGVTFTDNGNGTATLAGTPATGTGGSYPFTITAQNGIGTNATQSFTLTVDQAPAITSATSTTFSVGGAGSFSVTTTGFPTPSLSETGALPSGVTFVDQGNGTAKISGTASASGTFPITITANNGISPNATQSFTLTVNTAAAITSANSTTFTAGTAGSFTVSATGTPTPSFSESGSLPSGVTFVDNHNGTATLSGTPAASAGGTYIFTITATNTAGSNNQTFTLTVDQAPAITSVNSTTFTIGQSASFTVTASGFPIAALSETGALPTGVSFIDNGNNTAALSGIPAPGSNNSYTITITGNNGVSPNGTQTFTLNLNPPAAIVIMPATGAWPNGTVNQAYGPVTISATGGIQPYTFSIDGSGTQLPSPLTLTNSNPGHANNTGVISGTPSATATLTGIIVDVTDSNVPPTTQKVTYSLTVNSAGSQVSGQIFLNNQCGGSGTQPFFTVSINTTPVQTTTSDASGNYTFATVPNGTYTITPSITGASSLFYPATLTNVVVNNNSVGGENFSAEVGYTVSGTVTYSASGTPQTGQTYISVTGGCNGGNGGPGTSISETTLTSGGAYTIRGVPPGSSYTVQAWMDPLGQSVQNAIDPTGSASVTVTDANVTGVAITMHDPTYATPTSDPTIQVIIPNAEGVLIEFNPSQNSNGIEDANEYTVQWSTSQTLGGGTGGGQFGTIAGSYTFKAAGDNGVWILTNTLPGVSFTSGTTYYFQARSFNTLDTANPHPTGWCNYTSSGCSGVTGFTGVKIATPTCTGTCTAVSSSVTIPAAITIKAGAPLYLGMLQFSSVSGGNPIGIYVAEITNPINGANDFTVTVPSGSFYAVLGVLDQNNTGGIGAGAITNVRNNVQANLTISGATQTVPGITLPTSNSIASVSTQFSSNSCQGCGSPSTSYQLNFNITESDKLPVAVVLNSGPNVINTSGTVALDMGLCSQCGNPQFGYNIPLLGTPKVGDTYGFTVTYSDGTQDTGTTVTAAVTGWNGGATVVGASDAPTALAPNDTNSTSTAPTFTWTDSASSMGANFSYSFYINQNTGCSGNCNIWQIPGNNSKSNGFASTITSITWGTDPTGGGSTPTVGSLTTGDTYNWSIQVQDSNNNSAQTSVWYQP